MSSVQQSQSQSQGQGHCPRNNNACGPYASMTSSYYTAPSATIQFPYPLTGHLGFSIDIPHTAPVATPWYFGENPVEGRRELSMRPDPEMFAVDNIIPYITPKIPLVNIHDPSYNFDRARHTFHI